MITRNLLFLFLSTSVAAVAQAQLLEPPALDSVRTFTSLEKALKDPLSVFRLDLSGDRLKVLPEDVRKFKNLNSLELRNNKLKELPEWIGELEFLQEIDLGHNKLEVFPAAVCKLKHLKKLVASQNEIPSLPGCIGGLEKLVVLDLWSNDIGALPPEAENLKALRFLDLRVIQMNEEEQAAIRELVPWATMYFSNPCNCGF